MKREIGLMVLVAASVAASGLDKVKSEPDPEKRARAALEYANSAITSARASYMESDYKKAMSTLDEVKEAAELCLSSLNATGKDARRSPKAFKRAEQHTNDLLRRLRSLENDFGIDDRPHVLAIEQRLQEIHDELITRIMGKK